MITGARNARLFDDQGREYIDLCAGYGSAWLGHNHPAVQRALAKQLETYAAPGYLDEPARRDAFAAFEPFLPPGHAVGGIYSTGMEAVETAIRAAWAETGRRELVGFEGGTHGRSFLTSALGKADFAAPLSFVRHLPGYCEGEARLSAALDRLLSTSRPAAIVVEPVQMTGGGYVIPAGFCRELLRAAREHGVLTVFDETLTGLHRSGPRYFWQTLDGPPPDILILGKGLANGFPASAVLLRKGIAWDRERVRPGSTYWNHPLACAAVAATLRTLAAFPDPEDKVLAIAAAIQRRLGRLELHGRGAMWCLGAPSRERMPSFAAALREAGVVVSYYDRYVRLLPPLTIGLDELDQACQAVAAAYEATFG